MVRESAPLPDRQPDPSRPPESAPELGQRPKRRMATQPAPADDDDEDGTAAWDTVSLYEEILDEVEAFEYSSDGEWHLSRACSAAHI